MTKEAIAKAPSGRPQRQPVGLRNRQKTRVSDPNYVERWVVDYDGTGDRIADFKLGGYEHVPARVNGLKDSRVSDASPEGSIEVRHVGGGQKAYLMRIPREDYEADQREKARLIAKTEDALKKPALDGLYGKLEIETKDKE